MKIAYFSPLPPQKSGIAIYNAQLLPYLARFVNLTLYTDRPQETQDTWQHNFDIRDIQNFTGPLAEKFDVCLYQMGNNIAYHAHIYETLRRFPGIITLHDLNLHSFYGELHLKRDQFPAYSREMAYAYGKMGLDHVRLAHFKKTNYDVARFPLFERIVNLSLGMIVHSQHTRRLVLKQCPQKQVAHINLHQEDLSTQLLAQATAKEHLGYQPDDILLASFGYISPGKRIDVLLQALANLATNLPQLRYALVGQPVEGYNIQSLLHKLGLEKEVRLVGYADDKLFQTYLAATDVGINLRYPTHGETSSTLLALMAAAKPVLVSNVDAFKELPDAICLKINVGENEQADIESILLKLLTNAKQREAIGQRALSFIQQECDPLLTAQKYITFVEQIVGEGSIEHF